MKLRSAVANYAASGSTDPDTGDVTRPTMGAFLGDQIKNSPLGLLLGGAPQTQSSQDMEDNSSPDANPNKIGNKLAGGEVENLLKGVLGNI